MCRQCPCGSGEASWPEYDARGIYLCRVCEACETERLSVFRPDIFTDANYWTDEPVEEDY